MNSDSEVTYLFSEVLEICAILIGIFQWAMHFLIRLGAVVSRNTFRLDVVKEMGRKMFLGKIPGLLGHLCCILNVFLTK